MSFGVASSLAQVAHSSRSIGIALAEMPDEPAWAQIGLVDVNRGVSRHGANRKKREIRDGTLDLRMDPIADGNPIGWTIKTLSQSLLDMLERAGYPEIAAGVDLEAVRRELPQVEDCARRLFAAERNTVKHNRGTDIFEADNILFGREMRRLPVGDGGLAIHVLADLAGSSEASHVSACAKAFLYFLAPSTLDGEPMLAFPKER